MLYSRFRSNSVGVGVRDLEKHLLLYLQYCPEKGNNNLVCVILREKANNICRVL